MSSSDIGYYYVLDAESGTWFSAERTVLIDSRKLSNEQIDILNSGSDNERCELADEVGKPITTL
jgi:hypothetical protein